MSVGEGGCQDAGALVVARFDCYLVCESWPEVGHLQLREDCVVLECHALTQYAPEHPEGKRWRGGVPCRLRGVVR